MNTIATTFPDIPRIYTGIAEGASCLLFMYFLPRKRSNAMMAVIAALREKYDLHMEVERFVSDDGIPEQDREFIRK